MPPPYQFGGQRHSRSGDIIALVFHVISQHHVIKGTCEVIGRSPSR